MALSSQDESAILNDLLSGGLGRTEQVYSDYVSKIADDIVQAFKKQIKRSTDGSGSLAQSVIAKPNKDGFEIQADFYYKFVDEGVQGAPLPAGVKPIRQVVKNAPYKFKNLKVSKDMIKNIRSIVGGDISSVYAVAISIKKHGIKAKSITDNVITDQVLEQLSEDLTEVTGLMVDVIFEKATDGK